MKSRKIEEKRTSTRTSRGHGGVRILSKRLMTALLNVRSNARTIALLATVVCALLLMSGVDERVMHPYEARPHSYSRSVIRECHPDPTHGMGHTFEARVRGVNVSFAAWTRNQTNERDVVALRTHEAVRIMGKLKRAGTLLDVGANIGKVTFPTLAMAQTHTVIAVEPVGVNLDQLCMTANLNGWLGHAGFLLLKAAMSDRAGSIEIFVPEGREDNSALNEAAAVANVGKAEHGEVVDVVVGDTVLREGGFKPDLIKIDTQGHELHVLRGLKKYLSQAKAREVLVMAESDPKLMHISGVDPKEIYQLMVVELGYKAYCRPTVDVEDEQFVVKGTPLSRREYPPGGCRDIFYFKSRR
ncbi:Hexuronic acid methyltransferase AglP [Gracilariopsis chorda]|uniref:Hexuronic acid methyltransferase AglP n=1 Tax=Gracilariopsis chorda TaxID=448386 RepID=A0A2V3ITZ0_9FLOR|nr:Hexuronic acid methyltransferase AglP [Gracilariopsis chorda]|eukprot:PXF45197.1 Hexuronic acid methyltransferase AglP [Gracilariopsis chorda]